MNKLLMLFFLIPLCSNAQLLGKFDDYCDTSQLNFDLKEYYKKNCCSGIPSKSNGAVSNGSLKNGALLPYLGMNFFYFDSASYKCERAYVHSSVKEIILNTYDSLYRLLPYRKFGLMECSYKYGGELKPHKTHQNGLSVDFMMPKMKNDKAYYGLDTLGVNHYLLDFDSRGRYPKDESIKIDFDAMGLHLLLLNNFAKKVGYRIKKIIVQLDLKDELFGSKYGQRIKESGIYFAQKLPFIIDMLHDDHYHVDFEKA